MPSNSSEYMRAYRARNRERLNALDRARHAADRDERLRKQREHYAANKEQIQARNDRWEAEHQEEVKAAQAAHYRANAARIKARVRAWVQANPGRVRLHAQMSNANKTAIRLGLPGRLRVRDIEHLPLACVYCGATERLTLDHATPFARGGENHWSNLTTACLSCNDRKGTRTVAEFLATAA